MAEQCLFFFLFDFLIHIIPHPRRTFFLHLHRRARRHIHLTSSTSCRQKKNEYLRYFMKFAIQKSKHFWLRPSIHPSPSYVLLNKKKGVRPHIYICEYTFLMPSIL